MSEQARFQAMLDRLPDFDGGWSPDIQQAWWNAYWRLFRWRCRLAVYEAVGAYRGAQ